MNRKILIIGSNGILGRHILEKAITAFGVENLVISDYKEARLTQQKKQISSTYGNEPLSKVIDVNSEESIRSGLIDIDLVIVAIQQEVPLIQKQCVIKGINSIDLSVKPSFISKTLELNRIQGIKTIQLIMGGLFPGLSGILAKEIYESSMQNQPIDIGLLQSSNGTNGKSGVSDMLMIFDKDVELLKEETIEKHSGYSYKKKFDYPEPFGTKTHRLANFIERDYLKEYGIKSNYWTSFDKPSLNTIISVLKKLCFLKLFKYPQISRVLSSLITKQNKGDKNEFIGLSAKNSNNEISIVMTSDYEATASCTIAFARIILNQEKEIKGIKFPFEIFTFEELKQDLSNVVKEIKEIKAPNIAYK